jgi:hypothetical protein
VFGDPKACTVTLVRKKKVCGRYGQKHLGLYDRKDGRVCNLSCCDTRIWLSFEVRRVHCRARNNVKTEQLDFLGKL